jgi:EAL domain-containing protein (putative c-di-GMP-specific phosphodiesterase class I)
MVLTTGPSPDAPEGAASGVRDTLKIGPEDAERLRAAFRSGPDPAAQAVTAPGSAGRWVLESPSGDGQQVRRMLIHPLPFRIGRVPGLELVLPSQLVSEGHAEIYADGPGLRIRDQGSINGTFVNLKRIQDAPVGEGDILHVADFEFRLARLEDAAELEPDQSLPTVSRSERPLPQHFMGGTRELRELLARRAVTVVFQPIVRLPAGDVVAYEALGRGTHPGLPESPVELFRIAASIGAQADLSRLFRRAAVELLRDVPEPPPLFLNTDPAELESPDLFESLRELRAMTPQIDLVLEIHEGTLARPDYIAALRTRLAEINVGLAYDDFGSGQARLLELAEAPPHYLKFDRRFVTGIEKAPPSRRRFLSALVEAAKELRVKTIAEGVETAGEAEACAAAGFTHAQGFFYGHPFATDENGDPVVEAK